MNHWVMHVDMDAYFASVEQYRNHPELIGRPVCVGPDPRKGNGRGVARAVSYEARKYGIKAGMPVTTAVALCPDAVFVNGDFADYVEVSDKIMQLLRGFADHGHIRKTSIDEAYLEVTDTIEKFSSPKILAKAVQTKIKVETNLPCSVGMGPNMTVAKIATSVHKPLGITIIGPDPEVITDFLAPLSVKTLNGVGKKTARRLNSAGIFTLGDIHRMTVTDLIPVVGKGATWLYRRARGIDERPVIYNGPHLRKSIGKHLTFPEDVGCDDVGYLYSMLERLCTRIARKVIEKNYLFRTVTVTVRYSDFTTVQRSRSLPVETDDRSILLNISSALLKRQRISGKYVRMIGLRVSGLLQRGPQTLLTEFLY